MALEVEDLPERARMMLPSLSRKSKTFFGVRLGPRPRKLSQLIAIHGDTNYSYPWISEGESEGGRKPARHAQRGTSCRFWATRRIDRSRGLELR